MLTMSAETVACFYWQGLTIDRLTNMVYTGQRGPARERLDRRACREFVERAVLASIRTAWDSR